MYIEITPLGKAVGRIIRGLWMLLLILTPIVLIIMLVMTAVRCTTRAFSSDGRPPAPVPPTSLRPISEQIQFPPGPPASPLPLVQDMLRFVAPGSTRPNPLEGRSSAGDRPAFLWSRKIPVPKGMYAYFTADGGNRVVLGLDTITMTWIKDPNGSWRPEGKVPMSALETSTVQYRFTQPSVASLTLYSEKVPPPGRWCFHNPSSGTDN